MDPDSGISRFELVMKLLKEKSFNKITNKAFDSVIKVYNESIPREGLPKSFYEMKQYIKVLGLSYEKIHFCPNNCVLFWEDYENLDECPVCNESRWKNGDKKKKDPCKVLRYFQL